MEALAAAIQQRGSVTLEHTTVQTDHSFSDHRIVPQTILLAWLDKLKTRGSSDKRWSHAQEIWDCRA